MIGKITCFKGAARNYEVVTQEFMLAEILKALAASPPEYQAVTVSFGGGQTIEEFERHRQHMASKGLQTVDDSRQTTFTHVSLWKPAEDDGGGNDRTMSFIFDTDPEDELWDEETRNSVWGKAMLGGG